MAVLSSYHLSLPEGLLQVGVVTVTVCRACVQHPSHAYLACDDRSIHLEMGGCNEVAGEAEVTLRPADPLEPGFLAPFSSPGDCDPGNTGYISTGKFRSLLESHSSELDPHKREVLLALADSHADGQICYQDFVNLGHPVLKAAPGSARLQHCGSEVAAAVLPLHPQAHEESGRPGLSSLWKPHWVSGMRGLTQNSFPPLELRMSNKRSNSFRQAILQGNRRLSSKALLEEKGLSLSQRLIRHVAYETLPREIDRKWYYDSYTCCPPPWFMITVTLLEARTRVAFFLYNGVSLDQFVLQVTHPHYLKNSLVYHPQLRAQAWRYLTYIFMHAGIEHLGLNVVLQLLVGVPLEMVHGATRIGLVYVAGVVAGSLAVSVADMTAPVVGSSGGVYALVSAHLANIVMNWSGMKCQLKLLRMAVALICMSMEFGRAVWLRFHPSAYPPCPHPSFVAHLGGVAVGITLGVVVLRNYEQRLQDQSLWWIFVAMYTVFVLFAVFWNIFAYTLLDLKLPPPP
ncbi:Rhomboid-related protein 3 [Tupaia chinensis]|uniref:rhomboid protease n=1 Tax=Tupaia chinensis TaxID=246437 RepID=L9KH13_TUPCH|nr:Rhomboid-related protein 3 [Tupaia chinensis]